jgi:hypothetical protein
VEKSKTELTMDLSVSAHHDEIGTGKNAPNQIVEKKENFEPWQSEEKKKFQPHKRKRCYEYFAEKDTKEDVGDIDEGYPYKAANKLSKHPKSKPIKCASIKGCLSQQIDCCFKKYEQTSKLDKVRGSQHPQPPKTIHLKIKDRSKNDNISVKIGNCKS